MNDSTKVVFLSYASQDAAAVQRISASLRAAGIEVWCDQNELRGGDGWDREIKKHIRDCALFIPVISRTTQSRLEGYFRREWKFAVDRTLDMADGKPFLIPIVIDDTSDHEAEVPDAFRAVQWSRLTEGEAPAKFAALIARLLATEHITAATRNTDSIETQMSSSGAAKSRSVTLVLLAALVLASGAAVWYLRASHGSHTAAVGVAEAAESFTRALQINSAVTVAAGERGYAYLLMGEFQAALDSCTPPMDHTQYTCRAIAYDKLGRRSDADAAIAEMMKQNGDSASYQYAEVFAQRGDIPQALDWLETADRVGDTGLHYMLADSFVDSLRNEPRFKALQAKLNFP